MPFVSIDAKQLEVRVAALLSQDKVMVNEVITGVDAHGMNCTDIMKLPLTDENRTMAKVLTFRSLYGGTAYAFYMDNNMPNFSLKKWEQVVEAYYTKYKGLHAWQKNNFREVCKNEGRLVSPITHRIWQFKQYLKQGVLTYKWAEVCNFPVQGTAFDFIALWMVLCNRAFVAHPDIKFVMMVHDELLWDVPTELVDFTVRTALSIINNLDKHIEQFFGVPCNVPFAGDCKVGDSWGTCVKYTCT